MKYWLPPIDSGLVMETTDLQQWADIIELRARHGLRAEDIEYLIVEEIFGDG